MEFGTTMDWGSHSFDELQKKMQHMLSSPREEEDPDPNVRCTYCTRRERLVDFDQLKPGDHISMGGKNFMFNLGDRQITFYQHHAIVKKSVKKVGQASGVATLIHFYSLSFNGAIKIQETTDLLDLNFYEIYRVRYAHPTHRPEKIIERAESLTKSGKSYSVMSCNCEHFCHWCCIGNADSYQVNGLREFARQLAAGTLNIAGKTCKVVGRIILVYLDDIATVGWKGACCKYLPGVIALVLAGAYLLYCIYRHRRLSKDKALGQVCARCCAHQQYDLWMKFIVYCCTQAGGMVILSLITASTGVIAGCAVVIGVISMALIWGIPALNNSLRSPFQGPKVRIRTTEKISIGEVISFKYMLKMHDGIVSKVEKMSNKKAKISVIHYSLPSVFGRRVVQEDTLEIDLTEDVIKGHNYSNYDVHPPELVVQRARQRLGETKFGIFSNRSCHFVYWAKVNEDVDDAPPDNPVPTPKLKFERSIKMGEDISGLQQVNVDHTRGKKHATKTMDTTWARIPEDVRAGSVIEFKYGRFGRWHKAVTTEVHYPEQPSSLLSVTVVHCGASKHPCEESFEFDLRHDDIWILKYHPLCRYSRKDVVRRARERVGQEKQLLLSSHFAEKVVRKDRDERVTNFDMVKRGDVIIFSYWWKKHAAILTKVGKSDSKGNDRSRVTIIHYALETLFSTRTIKKETILMDLSRDRVYRQNYDEVTYPEEMVERRARSRLDEQRFSFMSNTSWDFVHWAKVVQSPAIVKMCVDDDRVKYQNEQMALLPKVGELSLYFQKVPVYAWRDLQPGIILEYRYGKKRHQAILIDVDYLAKKLHVVRYETSGKFALGIDTFSIDLKHDQLDMYRCDPNRCDKPEIIAAMAYEMISEQKAKMGKH